MLPVHDYLSTKETALPSQELLHVIIIIKEFYPKSSLKVIYRKVLLFFEGCKHVFIIHLLISPFIYLYIQPFSSSI